MAQLPKNITKEISIDLPKEKISLDGIVALPEGAKKIIVFAHGSGSGRNSPRNQFVASVLLKHNLGILLMDLLTKKEEAIDELTSEYRFDIPLLAKRLTGVAEWIGRNVATKHLSVGYFGASTGAAAALISAAEEGTNIFAIVSRGGRPDLAGKVLTKVKAPTLLIVGSYDYEVIDLNNLAFELLRSEKKMEIVKGATHLFEEPGTLEQVADLAALWFVQH